MGYELLVASEMEAFIRVLAAAGPGRMPDAVERKLHDPPASPASSSRRCSRPRER
jgi:hypothetical protein